MRSTRREHATPRRLAHPARRVWPWIVVGVAAVAVHAVARPGQDPTSSPAGTPVPVPVPLRPGDTHTTELTTTDAVRTTPALRPGGTEIRARSFSIECGEPGTYRIELRSYEVDPYLVLLDAETGAVLDEDDDSILGSHARIVVESDRPGATYRIDAGARDSLTGAIEIRVLAGRPEDPFEGRPEAGVAAELEDRRRRIAALEAKRGADDPVTLDAISTLGAALFRSGRVSESLPLFERVLESRRSTSPDDTEQLIPAMSNVALVLMQLGELERARPLMEQAFELSETSLGPDHITTATMLNNLAGLLQSLGDFEGARPLFERSLRSRETIYGPDHPVVGETCVNLALLLRSIGDYAPARPLLERAKRIHEAAYGDEHPMTAWSWNALALLLHELGDLDAAQRLFEGAIATFEAQLGDRHPMTTTAIGNLAVVLEDRGELASARRSYERALEIEKVTRGPEDPHVATLSSNLASVLRAQGDLEAAIELGEAALRSRERSYGTDHPITAQSCNNLSVLLADRGDTERAVKLSERALKIREATFGAFHPQTTRTLRNLAWHRLDLGDPLAACTLARRAIQSDAQQRRLLTWSLSESDRLAFANAQRIAFDTYLALAQHAAPDEARAVYEVVLEWKSRVWRSLVQTRGQALRRLPESDRTRVEALRRVQSRLADETYRTDVDDPVAQSRRITHLLGKRQQLETALARSVGPVSTSPPVDVAELAAALPRGTVVIDFLVHARHGPAAHRESPDSFGSLALSAWVLRAGEPDSLRWIDLGNADAVRDAVAAVLDRVRGSYGLPVTDPEGGHPVDVELRRRLFDPLRDAIGEANRIVVAPDSFLGAFPFEILRLDDGSYLLEKYSVVYTQDVTSFVRTHAEGPRLSRESRATTNPSLLCVGEVAYEGEWPALTATAIEANTVAELHAEAFPEGERTLLREREAHEARISAELPRHRVIHLATHGFFERSAAPTPPPPHADAPRSEREHDPVQRIVLDHPALLSGLVFAPTPAPEGGTSIADGRLTAEEISFLDLSEVELVVMSACESGLGTIYKGEGMLGLRRALRSAGVETVVSSLWKVSDDETLELMRALYDRLWRRGETIEDALRGAKLDRLRANRSAHEGAAIPFAWGAFVLDTGRLGTR